MKFYLLLSQLIAVSSAFQVAPTTQRGAGCLHPSSATISFVSGSAIATPGVDQEGKSSGGGLTFQSKFSLTTETAPKCTPSQMHSFFDMPESWKCLVTAGNKRTGETVETTPELLAEWKSKAIIVGAQEPTDSDTIVKVKTGELQFPGLKLTSLALIGCKVIPPPSDSSTTYPAFEFCLIKDENFPEGPRPIVSVFNALTGGNTGNKKNTSPISLSRITVVESDGMIMFESNVFIQISVKFPTFLFRILPVSKEKAEEQGSEAISKTVKDDSTSGLTTFRDVYVAWLDAQ